MENGAALLLTSLYSSIRGYTVYIVFFVAVIMAIVCIISYSKQVKARKKMNPVAPAPRCPICGSKMAPRVYSDGDKKGQGYWQCVKAPECSGTAEMVYLNQTENEEKASDEAR